MSAKYTGHTVALGTSAGAHTIKQLFDQFNIIWQCYQILSMNSTGCSEEYVCLKTELGCFRIFYHKEENEKSILRRTPANECLGETTTPVVIVITLDGHDYIRLTVYRLSPDKMKQLVSTQCSQSRDLIIIMVNVNHSF